ncbi:MAG: sigma-70 family RNA polymerase sigma factor [Hyphomicrobium sp.]|nr:sigma-70 family RNA polymerase sigma factor [Hyphomicrobium sp.]
MPRGAVATSRLESASGLAPAPQESSDETGLVARSASGDALAFRTLTERHLAAVTGIARRMLRDDAEAEDVAQEAFLRLWRAGATLEVGTHGVKPWLRRVVSNLCIDRVRGRQRLTVVEELPEQAEAPRQQTSLEQKDLQRRVDQALKKLPERQRLALTLFHYEGMSQSEVGTAMGISDEAVESLLGRARRALKAELQGEWKAMLVQDEPDEFGGV